MGTETLETISEKTNAIIELSRQMLLLSSMTENKKTETKKHTETLTKLYNFAFEAGYLSCCGEEYSKND